MTRNFELVFRRFGLCWCIGTKHERSGAHIFSTGTIHVRRICRWISVQWETRTPQQEEAWQRFLRDEEESLAEYKY